MTSGFFKGSRGLFLILATALQQFHPCSAETTDVPVFRIAPVTREGSTNAIVLRGTRIEVVIYPEAGRIGRIAFPGSDNLLRWNTNLLARPETGSRDWKNFGGEWIWPVRQEDWTQIGGKDWPPPPEVEARPWHAQAWVEASGRYCCLMTNFFGPPLNFSVSRFIEVDPAIDRIIVDQRISCAAESSIPASLWQVTQIAEAEEAVFAGAEGEWQPVAFTPPPHQIVASCSGAVAIALAQGTEHKLRSTAAHGWIAARRGAWVVCAQARGTTPGSFTELYSNRGLGYAEIETAITGRVMKVGQSLTNVLILDVYHLPEPMSGCTLAGWLQSRRETDTPVR